MTEPTEQPPTRQTAAQRRALPNLVDIAEAAAEKYGVCKRPIPMRAFNPATGESKYVAAECKSTRASDCPSCAAKARALRVTQCSEGWHMEKEPVSDRKPPTEHQVALLTARADLLAEYRDARERDDEEAAEGFREVIADLDRELRSSGMSGRIPGIDAKPKARRSRSTKRRQDVPNLPRKKIDKTTLGRQFAGKHRPSTFWTLTLPSYGSCHRDGAVNREGKVCGDGSPINPDTYDYRRAARDAIFFPMLFDRLVQNWRRAAGRDVQYFATVEPQRRGAPHVHIAARGTDPHELLNQVLSGTYCHVWWPHFDHEVYTDGHMPVWDHAAGGFADPDTGYLLPSFDDALALMDEMDDIQPAHVIRWGVQAETRDIGDDGTTVDADGEPGPVRPGKAKGVVGGGKDARKLIGYLTKYLTKSIGEVLEAPNERTRRHYERLHAELQRTPCSPTCAVWLRYGITPRNATAKTQPGRCKGKAHRRDTLGLRGRRVLVSRRWSNKTLPDHKADRIEFVRQVLAAVGIAKSEQAKGWIVRLTEPSDPDVPRREHLIMSAVAQRSVWQNEYLAAKGLITDPPGGQELSAIQEAA
ncbi:replication initiator [Nocardia wallacei]|uniref:replication initiator n=1 Tax=Nocardia wallacei TaxID=480035 RepID=UPI00245712A1|nr:replication initiator [Nocardia wallacei]